MADTLQTIWAGGYGSCFHRDDALELSVQPPGEYVDRAAVGIVGGIGDELVVRRHRDRLGDRIGVIGFEDAFPTVIELPVADQRAKSAGRDEVAVVARQRVDRAADADRVVGPAPFGALDRQAP